MNRQEKYEAITAMNSLTRNEYPSKTEFFRALAEGRVSGDYDKRIVIVSNDAHKSYTLVR